MCPHQFLKNLMMTLVADVRGEISTVWDRQREMSGERKKRRIWDNGERERVMRTNGDTNTRQRWSENQLFQITGT